MSGVKILSSKSVHKTSRAKFGRVLDIKFAVTVILYLCISGAQNNNNYNIKIFTTILSMSKLNTKA